VEIVNNSRDLASAVARLKAEGRLALVPTMGALHAGHLALVEEARRRADRVMATIFVNPLQFNDADDLAKYPRTEAEDSAKLEAAGCELLWMPTAEQLYPDGFATTVSVAGASERWEGEHRPGHFDGVATVVAKLLIATMPGVTIFGEKDWQQLAVIRRMIADLGLPVEIVGFPTVRDDDGLALSSRNARLSPEERGRALALPNTLKGAAQRIAAGEAVDLALREAKQALVNAGFLKIDYVALVDPDTLEPLASLSGEGHLIAAATIGGTRLIDNMRVVSDTVGESGSPRR
jgi:pantoate--beta-alanine ligase